MKKILAVVFLFAVCLAVRAFTPEEFRDAVCSIPEKYLLRFIGCTYDQSPEPFLKLGDVLYECVDEFYANAGRSDTILLFLCYDNVREDDDVRNCFKKNIKELKEPKQAELEEFGESARNCLISAK